MKVLLSYGVKVPKPKPRPGDEKMIKGVLHIRQQVRFSSGPYKGCYQVSGNRPVYEWVVKGGPHDREAQWELKHAASNERLAG